MGKATRWFKGLFGIKKEKDQKEDKNNGRSFGHSGRCATADGSGASAGAGLCHNPTTIPPNITPAEAAWLSSFYAGGSESDKEQSKHAIAVAAATAAAADAAVAAAQAAVAVVRLTSQGRGAAKFGREMCAAVKIQNVFRGFLARKALRALKGLVKLQALVRGYLVRRQASATLHCMQALMRAQASVRAQKNGRFFVNDQNSQPQFQARRSLERFDETRSERNVPMHSRRLSATSEAAINGGGDESPKIVEVDTGRPKSRSRRTNTWVSADSGEDPFEPVLSSPFPCRIPPRSWNSDGRNLSDWGISGDECRFSTAQSTPRIANSCCSNSNTTAPITPAKSVCVESYFRNNYDNYYPNYMAKTQSFKAKLRSHSAPKQRPGPEPVVPTNNKKRVSLNEMMGSRASLSGVRMQRSCSQVQEVVNFKNAVMGKIGNFAEFTRVQEQEQGGDDSDNSMQRKW